MSDFLERDWKLLRELKPVAPERLCEQILRRAAEITTEAGLTNLHRYLKMWKLIQEQNEEVALASMTIADRQRF
jgi:hypothetical protein